MSFNSKHDEKKKDEALCGEKKTLKAKQAEYFSLILCWPVNSVHLVPGGF